MGSMYPFILSHPLGAIREITVVNNNSIKSREHLSNTYVPETLLNALHGLSHVSLNGPLSGGCKYPHLTDEISDLQRGHNLFNVNMNEW